MPPGLRHKNVVNDFKPFPIFDLPPEVREMIWDFLVIGSDGNIYVFKDSYREKYHWPDVRGEYEDHLPPKEVTVQCSRPPSLSIFLASRQTYEEAMPIYYSKNTFVFGTNNSIQDYWSVRAANTFLTEGPRFARQFIKHIHLRIDGFSYHRRNQQACSRLVYLITRHMNIHHLTLRVIRLCRSDIDFVMKQPFFAHLRKITNLRRFTFHLGFQGTRCKSDDIDSDDVNFYGGGFNNDDSEDLGFGNMEADDMDFDGGLHFTDIASEDGDSDDTHTGSERLGSDKMDTDDELEELPEEPHDTWCPDAPFDCAIAGDLVRGVKLVEYLRSQVLKNGRGLGREYIRARVIGTAPTRTFYDLKVDNNQSGDCLLPEPRIMRWKYTKTFCAMDYGHTTAIERRKTVLPGFFTVMQPSEGQGYVQLKQAAYNHWEGFPDDRQNIETVDWDIWNIDGGDSSSSGERDSERDDDSLVGDHGTLEV